MPTVLSQFELSPGKQSLSARARTQAHPTSLPALPTPDSPKVGLQSPDTRWNWFVKCFFPAKQQLPAPAELELCGAAQAPPWGHPGTHPSGNIHPLCLLLGQKTSTFVHQLKANPAHFHVFYKVRVEME